MRWNPLKFFLILGLVALSVEVVAKSCLGGDGIYEEADAVFSLIPMKGEISIQEDRTHFDTEVFKVWKGEVQRQEQITVAWPRMLLLGDEYVLAADRDANGRFAVTDCTPVHDAYREEEWIRENLGAAERQYTPSLLEEP